MMLCATIVGQTRLIMLSNTGLNGVEVVMSTCASQPPFYAASAVYCARDSHTQGKRIGFVHCTNPGIGTALKHELSYFAFYKASNT